MSGGAAAAIAAASVALATTVDDPNQAAPPGQPATFGGVIGTCPAVRRPVSATFGVTDPPVTRWAMTSHGTGATTIGCDCPARPACSAARTSDEMSNPLAAKVAASGPTTAGSVVPRSSAATVAAMNVGSDGCCRIAATTVSTSCTPTMPR